jgi:hypothetical protein
MAKGNPDLDEVELRAARTMCAVYGDGWAIFPRDVRGAPPGTHDFDLNDGSTIVAVEVSTIADHTTVSDSAEWSRHFPDLSVTLAGLEHGWVIVVSARGRAKKTSQGLEVWLRELERLGLRSARAERWQEHLFTPEAGRPPEFLTLHAMAGVGIVSAHLADELPAGACTLCVIDDGFSWNQDEETYVSAFVSDQLADLHSSDVAKVGRATADRRALFLWLHAPSHFDVIRRLDNDLLEGSLTDTGTLDEVWIGRYLLDGSVLAYRWRTVDGWTQFRISPEALA